MRRGGRSHGLAACLLAAGLLGGHGAAVADEGGDTQKLPQMEVLGTAPLPGLGVPLRDIPANVQVFTSRDLVRQRPLNLGEYLEQNPTGVTINSAQGNPLQADVNFRGFTASPVLGTPQGLSVFQDGVRINEPFGDVVNWDLIPQIAIASLQLMPGSNPVYGLNTLGGALNITTKRGAAAGQRNAEAYAGSFGRSAAQFELGGRQQAWDFYLAAHALDDRGWADHNPSRVRQAFAKLGWRGERTDVTASLTLADNALQGTQTIPRSFFDADPRLAYTYPDRNGNTLSFLNVVVRRDLSAASVLEGNVYGRRYRNDNASSNVNADYDPVANAVQATNDDALVDQTGYGAGVQLSLAGRLAGFDHQLVAGVSADIGTARFTQDSQDAAFTADRGTVGRADYTRTTDAQTRSANYGLYFSDTLRLDARWTLTLSGRYNRTRIRIADASGSTPALNGTHAFSRFNPALGINFNPNSRLTAYAALNQGARTPTPIELACADPNAPCKLPNNFVSDPALRAVISRTAEAGLRGAPDAATSWSLAVYRTRLDDDIQFVSAGSGASNAGYFQNVGQTQRLGLELALSRRFGGLTAAARYALARATFESPFVLHSPSNSSADAAGDIAVRTGDRIPGIALHSLKLRLQLDFAGGASLAANATLSSAVHARGDENGRDANGPVAGYAVVHLDGQVPLGRQTLLFVRVVNLFDRRYANFGTLAQNWFTGPGRSFNPGGVTHEQFLGPGAPRGIWLGLRFDAS